jgi:hypothetical protein
VKYDPKVDVRLANDYQAARHNGQSRAEFARQKDITVGDLEKALKRVRVRRTR